MMRIAAREDAGSECVNSQTIKNEKGTINVPNIAQNWNENKYKYININYHKIVVLNLIRLVFYMYYLPICRLLVCEILQMDLFEKSLHSDKIFFFFSIIYKVYS